MFCKRYFPDGIEKRSTSVNQCFVSDIFPMMSRKHRRLSVDVCKRYFRSSTVRRFTTDGLYKERWAWLHPYRNVRVHK